ncbi:reverse transcriptase domain-containing protein [Actinomadura livida]|uniref:Group II intron reverse transcriptase/maturase n=2 Tax=Actinomadura livida TaxID=79909 RepID=A0A7W7I7A6_9ACTN|nr:MULTISPECIES: reverse transcriptase domain-containing protein [Actinomadura]MBB4771842.1 group II intron reverse transcriptase/maturase [Actinomadura catellatispora]
MRTREEMRPASRLVERMASDRALWAAWSRVAAGSGMAGADGVSAAVFGREVGPRLAALAALLRERRYQAQPLRPVRLMRGGKLRTRGLPTICDRIVQRAFLNVYGTRLNPTSPVSFSYRPGRSWLNALEQVQRYRDSGLTWVLRTDIANFFAEVDHRLLLEQVTERVRDPYAAELVRSWVRAPWLMPEGVLERRGGLPEGAPISPALAEFFLAEFDREVNGSSGRLVRYADDLTVLCPGRDEAMAALGIVERALAARELRINPDKTYIADFDFGFTLLGWRFIGTTAQPAGDAGTGR